MNECRALSTFKQLYLDELEQRTRLDEDKHQSQSLTCHHHLMNPHEKHREIIFTQNLNRNDTTKQQTRLKEKRTDTQNHSSIEIPKPLGNPHTNTPLR